MLYDVTTKQPYASPSGKLNLIIAPLYNNSNFPDNMAHCGLLNTAKVQAYINSQLSLFTTGTTIPLTYYPTYTPFFTFVTSPSNSRLHP